MKKLKSLFILFFAIHSIYCQDNRYLSTNIGCKIFILGYQIGDSVTWNGGCESGYASGKGTLQIINNSIVRSKYIGQMHLGKCNGVGTNIWDDGWKFEGTFRGNLFLSGTLYDSQNAVIEKWNNGIRLLPDNKNIIWHTRPQYEFSDMGEFHNGLISFMENDKIGLLNYNGDKVVEPIYLEIKTFNKDGFRVSMDGKSGVINLDGEIVIKLDYDYISPVVDGLSIVQKDFKEGVIKPDGKRLTDLKYHWMNIGEGLVCYEYYDNLALNSGYIDQNGKETFLSKYGHSGMIFSEGLAIYNDGEGKLGFVNKNGEVVIPQLYESAWFFTEGLASVKYNGKYGCIDKSNKIVIPFNYGYIGPFKEGLAIFELKSNPGFKGLIDKAGKIVVSAKYNYIHQKDGLSEVVINDKIGFVNKLGEEIIKVGSYSGLDVEGSFDKEVICSEGLICLMNEFNKYGYLDYNGKIVIPFVFDLARNFSDGLAAVKFNGKWGFIKKPKL